MKAFLVDLRTARFAARIAEAIAAKGINIEASAGRRATRRARPIVTRDDAGTRTALTEAKATFKEMEATETSMRHAPGTFAKAARRLADAGSTSRRSSRPACRSGRVGRVRDR